MLEWIKAKFFPKKKPIPKLHFKSGFDFFEYTCKYGYTELFPRRSVVALVTREEGFDAVYLNDDGRQGAALLVASPDGGFLSHAATVTAKGDRLAEGDLVLWMPLEYDENLSRLFPDPRTGWNGVIVAKIESSLDPMTSHGLTILSGYT